jgi:hypothetical protein
VKSVLAISAVIALVAVAADVHAQTTTTVDGSAAGGTSPHVTIERREVTVSTSAALVASGTIALSLGYGVAAVLAVSSTYGKDRLLFIPIAGPWIDLGLRPRSTTEENWARAGLVADGVAQLVGLVLVITGLVMKKHTPRPLSALVMPTGAGVNLSF